MHPGFSSQTWPWPGLSSVMESSFGQNRAEFPKSVPTCPQNLPLWMLHTCSCPVEMYMSKRLASPTMTISCQVNTPGQKNPLFRDIYTFAYHPLPAFVPSQKDPRFCPPYFKTCCIMHEPKRLQTSINHINTSCLAPVTVTQMGRFYATSGANDHNEKPPLQCLEGQIWIILIFHVGYGWSEVVAIIIFSSERESVVPAEGKRVNQASFHNRE